MTASRYGRQPLGDKMHEQRWTITRLAKDHDFDALHLKYVVSGVVRPNMDIRERIPDILGVPLEDLFTAEALKPPNTGNPSHPHLKHFAESTS